MWEEEEMPTTATVPGFGIELGELYLVGGDWLSVAIVDDESSAGRALIDRSYEEFFSSRHFVSIDARFSNSCQALPLLQSFEFGMVPKREMRIRERGRAMAVEKSTERV